METMDEMSDPRVWAVITDGESVVLGLRSQQCNNPGTWGFFGGHKHRGENPEAGVIRETLEETTYQMRRKHLRLAGILTFEDKHCTWYRYGPPILSTVADRMRRTPETSAYRIIGLANLAKIINPREFHYSVRGYVHLRQLVKAKYG